MKRWSFTGELFGRIRNEEDRVANDFTMHCVRSITSVTYVTGCSHRPSGGFQWTSFAEPNLRSGCRQTRPSMQEVMVIRLRSVDRGEVAS